MNLKYYLVIKDFKEPDYRYSRDFKKGSILRTLDTYVGGKLLCKGKDSMRVLTISPENIKNLRPIEEENLSCVEILFK